MSKQWHVETVSGSANDLETALNRIEAINATITSMTTFSGPYPSWTIVYYTYKREEAQL